MLWERKIVTDVCWKDLAAAELHEIELAKANVFTRYVKLDYFGPSVQTSVIWLESPGGDFRYFQFNLNQISQTKMDYIQWQLEYSDLPPICFAPKYAGDYIKSFSVCKIGTQTITYAFVH